MIGSVNKSKSTVLRAMDSGDLYGTSIRVANVANDGKLEALLTNPAGSSRKILWVALIASAEGKAYLNMYTQVEITVAGTQLFQVQNYAGCSKTSVAKTEYGGTYSYSAANLAYDVLIPGGSGPRSVGGLAGDTELAQAVPGVNVLIVLTNKAGQPKDLSLRLVWIDYEML